MNNYLEIASAVLRQARQPLSARQIMDAAGRQGSVPATLHGKTQHKTLHARIAEDIRRKGTSSDFVRTGPGRFFLRRLLSDPSVPSRLKTEYAAPRRAEQLRNFDVAFIERPKFPEADERDLFVSSRALGELESRTVFHTLGRSEEGRAAIRVFVVVHREGSVLVRHGMSQASDPLLRPASLGILGYLLPEDTGLFSKANLGLQEAAARTLVEHFGLSGEEAARESLQDDYIFLGLLWSTIAAGIESVVAALVPHACSAGFDPVSRFGRDGRYSWLPVARPPNDITSYDSWSQWLFRSGALTKVILAP